MTVGFLYLPKYLPLQGFLKISSCGFELLSLYFHFHQNSLQHFSQGRLNSIKLLSLNYLRISKFSFFKDIAAIDRSLSGQFFILALCVIPLSSELVLVVLVFNEKHLLFLLRTSCFCFAPFKILFLLVFGSLIIVCLQTGPL